MQSVKNKTAVPIKNKDYEKLNSLYRDLADMVGYDNAVKLYDAYKGTQLTFPKKLYSREYITKCIIDEYDGTNIKDLSTKYDYSERWVRKILLKK